MDILCDIYSHYKAASGSRQIRVKELLIRCNNSLYGTMVVSLLLYRKFTNSLKEIGLKQNPYDPCVFNTITMGLQMTICFHVDNCKMSHCNKKSNYIMIKWLWKEYKSIFEDGSVNMAVSRRNAHVYLGMTFYYRICGRVNIAMFDYID